MTVSSKRSLNLVTREIINVDKLSNILIVAGTHGNELSGIYTHKLIEEGLFIADRSTFSSTSVIANPTAVRHQCRYLDNDLNRQFATLSDATSCPSNEALLARQFIDKYASNNNQLIVDLHNTTSNMGATLILLSENPFYRKMGAYVKQRMPAANILFESHKPWNELPYLCTCGEYGVMIEVGAQSHGSLQYGTLELMKEMLTAVLDFVEKHNLNQLGELSNYTAYYYTQEITYPLDSSGMRQAMIHPTVCGRDFEAVKPGEPLLATFFGYDVHWQGEQDVYPHFINESAYSKANIAMALAEKQLVSVNKP
nr:aspartoacylase [Vibrio brasiliensis]